MQGGARSPNFKSEYADSNIKYLKANRLIEFVVDALLNIRFSN